VNHSGSPSLSLTLALHVQAYRLNPKAGGPYMQEALDEMVLLLTKPEYKGKMVVILAGYEAEVGIKGFRGSGGFEGAIKPPAMSRAPCRGTSRRQC
jgi:hypothetical protein